jgi:hypothetical protein
MAQNYDLFDGLEGEQQQDNFDYQDGGFNMNQGMDQGMGGGMTGGFNQDYNAPPTLMNETTPEEAQIAELVRKKEEAINTQLKQRQTDESQQKDERRARANEVIQQMMQERENDVLKRKGENVYEERNENSGTIFFNPKPKMRPPIPGPKSVIILPSKMGSIQAAEMLPI